MLFGAALGVAIKTPYIAIIAAYLGHYFLDLFPHVEYFESVESAISKLKTKRQKKVFDISKVLLDFSFGLLIIFFMQNHNFIAVICGLVALIPDGLTVIYHLFPNQLLKEHQYFHSKVVHFLKHKKISVVWRIFTQVMAAVVSMAILWS